LILGCAPFRFSLVVFVLINLFIISNPAEGIVSHHLSARKVWLSKFGPSKPMAGRG
jgi:hypothetical protein